MTTPPPASSPWPQFLAGMQAFLPLAVSIAAYGVVWGVIAGQAGLTPLEVVLMSGLVFAGASQFVVLDMWQPANLPILSIVVSTAIINLRFILMTGTLRPLVAHLSRPRALLSMAGVSDEPWALTMAAMRTGRGSVPFLLGLTALCWLSWVASTVVGRLVGALIDGPEKYGLDFAFTATFIALLLGMWKGKGDIVPWLVGGLAAIAASRLIEGNWYIIIGGLCGSFAGAVVETRRSAAHVA